MLNAESIFLNCNTLCTETTITCTSWPDSEGYACTKDGDGYKELDGNLNASQTTECESLCKQKGEDGCCYLCLNGCGCYWNKGATGVRSAINAQQIAIKCSVDSYAPGKLSLSTSTRI